MSQSDFDKIMRNTHFRSLTCEALLNLNNRLTILEMLSTPLEETDEPTQPNEEPIQPGGNNTFRVVLKRNFPDGRELFFNILPSTGFVLTFRTSDTIIPYVQNGAEYILDLSGLDNFPPIIAEISDPQLAFFTNDDPIFNPIPINGTHTLIITLAE